MAMPAECHEPVLDIGCGDGTLIDHLFQTKGCDARGIEIDMAEVTRAVDLTPGIESPTVSPLHRQGWVAVRAMVPRNEAHRVMDELWTIGARGILVTDIHACRL